MTGDSNILPLQIPNVISNLTIAIGASRPGLLPVDEPPRIEMYHSFSLKSSEVAKAITLPFSPTAL